MKKTEAKILDGKQAGGQKYVSNASAAIYIDRSESFLEKTRHFGIGGPPYYRTNRSIYYKISDLDQWIESRKYRSTSEYAAEGGAQENK